MPDVIEYFMWAFQPHFRMSTEHSVERAFEVIGFDTDVRVFLIGFLQEDGTRHPICIEPGFRDTMGRIFPELQEEEVEQLWRLAITAANQAKGTMLVFSAAPAGEAERLRGQATAIEPVLLNEQVLARVTGVDGAVLLSPKAECHAFGVILDGEAVGAGDRSRGARYNSAVRYLARGSAPTAIVLVSEDGMIDVLPRLMPRVHREEISLALEAVRQASALEDFKPEGFYRAWENLNALRFYLSEAQCAEANRLREDFEERRFREHNIRLGEPPLASNPEMNDSYFID